MADDDPYDFEIAIPAAAGAGRGQAPSYGRYNSDNSGGSGDDSEDGSSDLDGEESRDDVRGTSYSRAAASRSVAVKAAPGGTLAAGDGNALDKARSFLAKYSTRTVETKPVASRRSRLELSMDEEDEELELDSYRDAGRRPDSRDERDRDSSSNYKRESPVKQPVRANMSESKRPEVITAASGIMAAVEPLHADFGDDYEDEDESGAPPPYSARPVVVAVATSSAPTYSGADKWNSMAAAASRHAGSDGDEQSIEAESVASQSEILESPDASDFHEAQAVSTQPMRMAAQEQDALAQSGVYEDEGFDEESVPASPAFRPAERQAANEPERSSVLGTAMAAKVEPTFDYSMDFSDDGEAEKKTSCVAVDSLPAVASVRVEPPVSDTRSDYESESERSALLESDDDSDGSRPNDSPAPVSSAIQLTSQNPVAEADDGNSNGSVASLGGHSAAENERYRGEEPDEQRYRQLEETFQPPVPAQAAAANDRCESATAVCSAVRPEIADRVQASQPQQAAIASAAANARLQPSARPRVVIVRAYESPGVEKPEMRDASTQFTGNHAAIQTELVPDGMHNLQEPQGSTRPSEAVPRATTASQPLLVEPPPAPAFPLPSYSLDVPHEPLTASTSLYKQQLLALQEQIQQKKRETERLVSERMTFQYSSLRGTERFIAGRRPPKLPLWQALMRVDPTLDEAKAKEAARLAQAGFTA